MKKIMVLALVAVAAVACSSPAAKVATTTATVAAPATTPTPVITAVATTVQPGPPTTVKAPPPTTAQTAPPTTAVPLSFYAAQYTRIAAASDEAQAEWAALPASTTYAEAQPDASKIAFAVQERNVNLLRAEWPPAILVDIRAMVVADGPAVGDLEDLVTNAATLTRDAGAASAAANIVLADLRLPAMVSA